MVSVKSRLVQFGIWMALGWGLFLFTPVDGVFAFPFTIYCAAVLMIQLNCDRMMLHQKEGHDRLKGAYVEEYARLLSENMAYADYLSPGTTRMEVDAAQRRHLVQVKSSQEKDRLHLEAFEAALPGFWTFMWRSVRGRQQ
jgi:hypothetical protein|tara:strand:- start:226 stop:645 length:420 start_codon:yes stop_codon:yes gene_type:complete